MTLPGLILTRCRIRELLPLSTIRIWCTPTGSLSVAGVVFPVFFNQLEHFCHALSGLLFLAACWTWVRESTPAEERQP